MTEKLVLVDVEAVARRFLASPRYSRLSVVEEVAICTRLLQLIEAHDQIADAVANFLHARAAFDARGLLSPSLADSLVEPFHALKAAFEKEFPNGEH
jgi:hypothetical protein